MLQKFYTLILHSRKIPLLCLSQNTNQLTSMKAPMSHVLFVWQPLLKEFEVFKHVNLRLLTVALKH